MIIDNKPLVFLFFLQQTLAGEGELVGDLLRDQLDHHDPKRSPGPWWLCGAKSSANSLLVVCQTATSADTNTLQHIDKQTKELKDKSLPDGHHAQDAWGERRWGRGTGRLPWSGW